MKVSFSREAEQGLERIADYIAQDHPARAASFTEELIAAALDLGDMPNAFPLVPRFKKQGIRRRVHDAYLIFYKVRESEVLVVAIMHGARDYTQLLVDS